VRGASDVAVSWLVFHEPLRRVRTVLSRFRRTHLHFSLFAS
jgi:hypothetical protein